MINWIKDKWEDVKLLLDELEYDYQCDFEGNLILHFENFDIVEESTKTVVDTVDHMWLRFKFHNDRKNYSIQWYRSDIYNSRTEYTHPHVQAGSDSHCTGDYVRGISLLQDLLYYKDYVQRYNEGQGWTTIPDNPKLNVDVDSLNTMLIPTFYMDITKGYPVCSKVEIEEDINKFIKAKKLDNPKTFFWKNNQFTQYSKGSRVEHINLKLYFDYAKFFERYNNATSTVSDADFVQATQ